MKAHFCHLGGTDDKGQGYFHEWWGLASDASNENACWGLVCDLSREELSFMEYISASTDMTAISLHREKPCDEACELEGNGFLRQWLLVLLNDRSRGEAHSGLPI